MGTAAFLLGFLACSLAYFRPSSYTSVPAHFIPPQVAVALCKGLARVLSSFGSNNFLIYGVNAARSGLERRRHTKTNEDTDDDVMHRSTHRAARVASVAPPHPSPPSAAPAVLILANGRARDVERLERSAERAASSPPRPSSHSRRESSRSHRSTGRTFRTA